MLNEGERRLVLLLPEDGPWPLRLETSISFALQQGSSGLDANEQARTLRTATNRGSAEQGLSGLDANEQARTLGTATVRGRIEQAFAPAKRPRPSTNHEGSHTRNDVFLEIEDDEDEEVADLPVVPRDSAYAADLARPARTSSTGVRAGPRVSFRDDAANEQYSRDYEGRAGPSKHPSFSADAFEERFTSIMSSRAGPSNHRASSADALSNEEHSPIAAARAWTSSFRLDENYDAEANEVFGNPSGLGLNGTSGTENSVNRVRAFFTRVGYHPAVDVLRSHLLNEVNGVAGGLPRCPIRKFGLVWGWHLPGMRSPVVLEREDVERCGIKTAKDGETGVQFKIEYEPGFQAIDRLTLEEAAELRGAKISFKIWRDDKALTDWQPLRRSKPTPALQYLYCEAMKALCEVGAATKETVKKPALKQGKDNGAANTLDKSSRL